MYINKKFKLSILALIAAILLVIGSTYAWFTDSVSNTNNIIKAGTLDIKLERKNDTEYEEITDGSSTKLFDYDKWEPGYTQTEILKLSNAGNLALKYKLNLNGTVSEVELAEVIDVYAKISNVEITALPDSFEDVTATNSGYIKVGTLKDVLTSDDTDGFAYGVLLPEESTKKKENEEVGAVYVGLILHMQEEAGNDYQGLSVGGTNGFTITLNATQYTYEEDGFGSDQYDANPISYKITFNFSSTSYNLASINNNAEIEINGVKTSFSSTKADTSEAGQNIIPFDYKAGDKIKLTLKDGTHNVHIYKYQDTKNNDIYSDITIDQNGYYEFTFDQKDANYYIDVLPAWS